MKKFLISLFLLSSLHLYSEEVVVSPSSEFQSFWASMNSDLIGSVDYYLYDFLSSFSYITEILATGNYSLQEQSIQQTEKLQDLIDNIIDYVEPQLEEIRFNSTSEIVPTLHSLEQRQIEISTDIKDIANKVDAGFNTANEGINDISTSLDNLYELQDEMNQNDKEHQEGQKEYYNSLEAAVNSLQKSLVDEVGPNLFGISEHIASINEKLDFKSTIGYQVEILRALGGNTSVLDDILVTINAMSSSSNSFPQEILDDYKEIDRDGESLDLGWKSSFNANTFTPGNVSLTSMDNVLIKGGYFEQVLQLLKSDTKVDIESKETLLMILKTLNTSEDNTSKANEVITDISSQNNAAERAEQSAVDTADRIELSDNDKYKSQLTKLKDTAQNLVSYSRNFNDAPYNVYLNLRAQNQTYNTQYHLPGSFIDAITTIHDSMPWIYGLIIFGSLSGLFFYLLGILYQVITHYKVV